MKKDFKIGQSNELDHAGRVFDIHNQYDFSGVEVCPGRFIRLIFDPNREYGAGEPALAIVFEKVRFLEFSAGFGTRDVSCVEEMGYKNPTDRDDEWLLDEKQASPNDHFFLRLSEVDYIRVGADAAHIEVRPPG